VTELATTWVNYICIAPGSYSTMVWYQSLHTIKVSDHNWKGQ